MTRCCGAQEESDEEDCLPLALLAGPRIRTPPRQTRASTSAPAPSQADAVGTGMAEAPNDTEFTQLLQVGGGVLLVVVLSQNAMNN